MDKSFRDKVCNAIVPKDELPSDCIAFRLPSAPSLQYYCIYGHGKETEVSVCLAWENSHSDEGIEFRGLTGEQEFMATLLLAFA